MKKEKNDLTLSLAFIQFFYWGAFAAVLAFTSAYLLETGLTNSWIGIVIALGGTVSALCQPLVSAYADKDSSPSVKNLIFIIGSIAVLSGILLLVFGLLATNKGYGSFSWASAFTGVFYGLAVMLLQLLQPFVNALGMESLNQGYKMNFGFTKAFGSAGYAAASYFLGFLVEKLTPHMIPIFISGCFLIMMVLLVFFPFKKVPKEQVRKENIASSSESFFKRYKRFMLVVLGLTCLYVGHTVINSFILQIIEPKGGGSAEMGTCAAICAIIELPLLFLFATLSKKIRGDIFVRISSVFFTLKVLFSLLARTMTTYYLVQIFQIGGWGLMTVAIVYYVNAVMKPEDSVKGQGYATMAYTIGTVTGALLGGWLLDSAGVNMLLITGTCISAVGSLIIVIFAEKVRNTSESLT